MRDLVALALLCLLIYILAALPRAPVESTYWALVITAGEDEYVSETWTGPNAASLCRNAVETVRKAVGASKAVVATCEEVPYR